MPGYARRPEWLRLSPLDPNVIGRMRRMMRDSKLHTVCESARCPNRTECFAHGTATFLILGGICTRNCTFCAVPHGKPRTLDCNEPEHIAETVGNLGLEYVVVTSVTRDDLPDGGAGHFAQTIKAIHEYDNGIAVEVLVPDFQGSSSALQTVIAAAPSVLNHNVETVPRLYPDVRPEADYRRSVQLLQKAKFAGGKPVTKSGIMLGLGERRAEVIEVMADLRGAGCDIVTIGQYLKPSLGHHELVRYILPKEFAEYRNIGMEMGFAAVTADSLVRSSFHAAETYSRAVEQKV
ncbi:lipoyl synthase [Chloroflexota bacterium]